MWNGNSCFWQYVSHMYINTSRHLYVWCVVHVKKNLFKYKFQSLLYTTFIWYILQSFSSIQISPSHLCFRSTGAKKELENNPNPFEYFHKNFPHLLTSVYSVIRESKKTGTEAEDWTQRDKLKPFFSPSVKWNIGGTSQDQLSLL